MTKWGGTQAGAGRVAQGATSAAVVAGIKKPKSVARKPKWISKKDARTAETQKKGGEEKKHSCQNVGQQYKIHSWKHEWKLAGQNGGQEATKWMPGP